MAKLVISGDGKMGTMLAQGLDKVDGFEVVGLVSPLADSPEGTSEVIEGKSIPWSRLPRPVIEATGPDVLVDFTHADFAPVVIAAAVSSGVRPVVGTSGLDDEYLQEMRTQCDSAGIGGLYAANFAIGAVVLQHLAKIASRFFERAELIELHHEGKVDAPSGTALAIAEAMRAGRGSDFEFNRPELTHIDGTRSGELSGIGIHSIRLPGFVASHEIIFGDVEQKLTIRHDSIGRDSFLPGVTLGIQAVLASSDFIVGLESIIGLEG